MIVTWGGVRLGIVIDVIYSDQWPGMVGIVMRHEKKKEEME